MFGRALDKKISKCVCGEVVFEALGEPIASAACHCDDCQAGWGQVEALEGAAPVLGAAGGSEYLMCRKDRVACVKGAELLKDFRLKPTSPTRRVVATCCNTGMFLDFEKGHWFSMLRSRFEGEVRELDVRIQTQFLAEGEVDPGDVPSYKTYSKRFVAKLMAAKVAMMLWG